MEVILRLSRVVEVQMEQVRSAWQLAERYGFSHFDSLIVASALAAGCHTLYTEDLHHGQRIDERLIVLDTFW